MLMEAPFASSVPRVTVPDDQVELNPPPFGCDGGCSNVVPCTLTVQGVVATPFETRHVTESLIPETTTSDDVRGRRSAIPPKMVQRIALNICGSTANLATSVY